MIICTEKCIYSILKYVDILVKWTKFGNIYWYFMIICFLQLVLNKFNDFTSFKPFSSTFHALMALYISDCLQREILQ